MQAVLFGWTIVTSTRSDAFFHARTLKLQAFSARRTYGNVELTVQL